MVEAFAPTGAAFVGLIPVSLYLPYEEAPGILPALSKGVCVDIIAALEHGFYGGWPE